MPEMLLINCKRLTQNPCPFPSVFQDVHIMLFVGFAFLMAFLRQHGYSSSGYTLVIGATIIQWGMLVSGLISNAATGVENPAKVKIGIKRFACYIPFGIYDFSNLD